MEAIEIEQAVNTGRSWWLEPETPRIGFTEFAADLLKVPLPCGDASEREGQLVQRHMDILAVFAPVGRH